MWTGVLGVEVSIPTTSVQISTPLLRDNCLWKLSQAVSATSPSSSSLMIIV